MGTTLTSKVLADRLLVIAADRLIIRYYLQLDHRGMPHTLHFQIYSLRKEIGSHSQLTKVWGAISNAHSLSPIRPIQIALCPSKDYAGWLEAECKSWANSDSQRSWHTDREFMGCIGDEPDISRTNSAFLTYHGRILELLIKNRQLWNEMVTAEPSDMTAATHQSRLVLAHRYQEFVAQLEHDSFRRY